MIGGIKSEIRKLYTIRSTYVILIIAIVIMGIFAFWSEGYNAGNNSTPVTDPTKLANLLTAAMTNLGILAAIVAILSITHEYRYNTMTYTLTDSSSRTKALVSKIVALTVFAVFFSVFVSVFALALMYLGLAFKGLHMAHRTIPLDLIWRITFVAWGFSMLGLLLGFIIRHQPGTIIALLLIPIMVEPLLGRSYP